MSRGSLLEGAQGLVRLRTVRPVTVGEVDHERATSGVVRHPGEGDLAGLIDGGRVVNLPAVDLEHGGSSAIGWIDERSQVGLNMHDESIGHPYSILAAWLRGWMFPPRWSVIVLKRCFWGCTRLAVG